MTLYVRLSDGAFGLTAEGVQGELPPELTFVDGADLTEWGFAPYEPTDPPSAAWNEYAAEIAPADGVQRWELVPNGLDLESVRASRLEELSTRRKAASQAFSFGGMPLKLDPDTENAISKAIMSLERQPAGTVISWEVSRGVIVGFDLPTLEAIGDAAFLHVQACFANVAAITAAINAAATREAILAVDLESGWP